MRYLLLIVIGFYSGILYSQQSHNMKLLAHFPNNEYTSSCWGYEANGREYAIYGKYRGTSVIDITDEDDIREVAFKEGKVSGWREMKIYKDYLYIVSEADSSGLQIIDLSGLPYKASLRKTYYFEGFGRAHSISENGGYLYINGGNYLSGGIIILNISDPVNPVKAGEWQHDYVHDSRIVNDTIWACNPLTGRVSLIDAVNKTAPSTITSWVNGQYPVPHNNALTADNKYLFVCDENFVNPGKLKIWNVADKQNITYVNSWSIPATNESIHNVEIFGHYAFIAYYGEGVRVLDVSDPANPNEIAWYKTTACWQVYYFDSGKIIASDIYDGLYILKTEEPISVRGSENYLKGFSLSQNYPNPFNPATNIKLDIPKAGFVKLTVFDVRGKEIQTLVNEQLSPGKYNYEFDASHLPSGIYYYKLGSGDFTQTKKMVLIK